MERKGGRVGREIGEGRLDRKTDRRLVRRLDAEG